MAFFSNKNVRVEFGPIFSWAVIVNFWASCRQQVINGEDSLRRYSKCLPGKVKVRAKVEVNIFSANFDIISGVRTLAQTQTHGSRIGFLGNGDGGLCRVIFGVDLGRIKGNGAVSYEELRDSGSLVDNLELTEERRGGGLIRQRFCVLVFCSHLCGAVNCL